ncbi:sulfurtransferase-like selenium metabolism protein YedF [Vibrio sp. JC009]|uniref:sulfurtransferase-like selenium metabolism protein YedF n=1 Tax=Vibrio sp. JC009 TaxID=2912314 RepID=UPI0023B03DA7|nr:sulfurtransferase-like selenium metabolism protein YedF [Vibrio sp. JC009]WED23777.1 sulfurtransferase-like selenium metabolism protein YedF [Vibrio sp. JC009]
MNNKLDVRGMDTETALRQLEGVLEVKEVVSLEVLSSDQDCTKALVKVLMEQGASCEMLTTDTEQKIIANLANKQVIRQKSYVVGSDTLGSGDDLLGGKLMTAFFSVHSQYEQVPASMFFLNTGARLCVEGAEALAALKVLESKGTEIIVCGTCLSFFELTDKLAVGRIGSMHDFVAICQNQSEVVNL